MFRPLARLPVLFASLIAACGSHRSSSPGACASPAIADGGMVTPPAPASAYQPATCVLPLGTPTVNGVRSLGQIRVGTSVGFSVPPNTAAVSIVSQVVAGTAPDHITYKGVPIPNSVVPTDVLSPDPSVFYDDLAPYPTGPDPFPDLAIYYGALSPADGAMTIPNTSYSLSRAASAGLPAGDWSFVVNDFAYECFVTSDPNCSGGSDQGVYDVSVIARTGSRPSRGTVDLAVYVVSHTFTAASLRSGAAFERFVESYAEVLGRAGICLGTVTVFDVPDWARDLWWTVGVDADGPCDPLAQLFTLSQHLDAIHLFLVDDLTSAQDNTQQAVAGVDGTIPGPSGVPGGVTSGTAIAIGQDFQACSGAFDPASCGSDFLAYIASHEAGHWLGLYHPTEAHGSIFDPLADTATCACDACATQAQRSACGGTSAPFIYPSSCLSTGLTCGGGRNLMFWIYQDQISTGELTAEQSQVMRLNPVVH